MSSKIKHYVEYYQKYDNGEYAPCVGSESIAHVDNRLNLNNMKRFAFSFKYKPYNAVAFKICRGTSILDCEPITDLIYLQLNTIINIKYITTNFWGDKVYQTENGTNIVKLDEGFYTLTDNEDIDSDPFRRLKSDVIKIID